MALLDAAPKHLAKRCPAPCFPFFLLPSHEYRGACLSQSLLRDVFRTPCSETSTLTYGLEQMNLCCVKTLKFYGSLFLCYLILTSITLLSGLFNDAPLLVMAFCSEVDKYNILSKIAASTCTFLL